MNRTSQNFGPKQGLNSAEEIKIKRQETEEPVTKESQGSKGDKGSNPILLPRLTTEDSKSKVSRPVGKKPSSLRKASNISNSRVNNSVANKPIEEIDIDSDGKERR